jgi:hypothetical protein
MGQWLAASWQLSACCAGRAERQREVCPCWPNTRLGGRVAMAAATDVATAAAGPLQGPHWAVPQPSGELRCLAGAVWRVGAA